MVYFKYMLVMVLFISSLMADVTALQGGIDMKNRLHFSSEKGSLDIEVNDNAIQFLTTDENLLIGKGFTAENVKAYAGKRLFSIYIKQTKKSFFKTTSYKFTKNLQKLTSKEIKSELSKALDKRVKRKDNYLSHKILNINIPDDITDSIDIEYKILYKSDIKKIRVFTYKQLLSALINYPKPKINIKRNFILQYKKRYFIADISLEKSTNKNSITHKDMKSKLYIVKIVKELKIYKKKLNTLFSNIEDNPILKLAMSNSLPLSLSIMDKNANLIEFHLVSIHNTFTQNYLDEEKKRAVVLNNFDFSQEPVWANFKVDTSNGVEYLKTDYKMVGKRKNIIQVSLNGNSSILNPQSKSMKTLTHNAYIVDIKTFLFEMKKILKENGKTKLKWTQKVKQSMLGLMYKDSDGNMVKKKISRGRKQFYDISGLWYLISWSAKNNITMKSFLFMKEDFPFEAKYSKTSYGYLVSQRGVEIFRFYLDEYNRITKVIDIENDITITLSKNGYINKSINENIKFLDNYLIEHNLKKVD